MKSQDLMNPFLYEMELTENKSKITSALGKSKKRYTKFSELKQMVDMDDTDFDVAISDMKSANRFSNKYIFTQIDDEPAVGITAAKRKPAGTGKRDGYKMKSDPESASVDTAIDASDISMSGVTGADRGDNSISKKGRTELDLKYETLLWRAYKRHGLKGLMGEGKLPSGWDKMEPAELITEMSMVPAKYDYEERYELEEAVASLFIEDVRNGRSYIPLHGDDGFTRKVPVDSLSDEQLEKIHRKMS